MIFDSITHWLDRGKKKNEPSLTEKLSQQKEFDMHMERLRDLDAEDERVAHEQKKRDAESFLLPVLEELRNVFGYRVERTIQEGAAELFFSDIHFFLIPERKEIGIYLSVKGTNVRASVDLSWDNGHRKEPGKLQTVSVKDSRRFSTNERAKLDDFLVQKLSELDQKIAEKNRISKRS